MIQKAFCLFIRQIKLPCICAALIGTTITSFSQETISLVDLSSFKSPTTGWQIAGDVRADLKSVNSMVPTTGKGILVNLYNQGSANTDLITLTEYGDMDLELEYMMAKGSNSGIYLQNRYEVQLGDSWGLVNAKAGDNGGLYERWDEKKPEGQKGYQGYAPRQNVSKAPGLWQRLKISFQAPRFANGNKISNAIILRAELNGVVIHENLELFGPTRGGLEPEVAVGPLRIQGDHGTVAFRNIRINNFNNSKPVLSNLAYTVFRGIYEKEPDYIKQRPYLKGSSAVLTTNINNLPDSFVLRYTGTLTIATPGEYRFSVNTVGGRGSLKINDQALSTNNRWEPIRVTLPQGNLPFELTYSKFSDWGTPSIGLTVSGPGIREFVISDANNISNEQTDPILLEAPVNTILRSFVDIPGQRVTHAVSVGTPEAIHYTYDMDNAAIVQVWRGGFLDATPMWHERGDGSSRPSGSKQLLGKPVPGIAKLSSLSTAWPADTAGTFYRPKGYELDEMDRPTFNYFIYNKPVKDVIRVLDNRGGITREISVDGVSGDLYVRLGEGSTIEDAGNGLYLIDDKSYYLRIEDAGGEKAFVRDSNNRKELLIPVKTKIKYTILF